ncbi:hypothetical protein ACM66B_005337 [Microbotryomycetes sp. NB124-2]
MASSTGRVIATTSTHSAPASIAGTGAGLAGLGTGLQPIAEEAPAQQTLLATSSSRSSLADRSNQLLHSSQVTRKVSSVRRKPAPVYDEPVAQEQQRHSPNNDTDTKPADATKKKRKRVQRSSEDAALFSEAKSLYEAGVESAKKKSGQLGALPLFRQAYKVFGELGCDKQANKSLWKLAMTLATIGHDSFKAKRHTEALNMFSEARALFRHIGEPSKEAMALYQSGLVYVSLREHEQALLLLKEAGRLFAEHGDETNEAMCLCETANVVKKRDASTAIEYFKQALLIYLRTRDSYREAKTLYAIGTLASTRKDYAEAFAYLQQARVIFRQRKDSVNIAHCSYQLGKLYNRAHELELSVGCFEEASRCYHDSGKVVDEAWCYYRLGLAMLKARDRSTAADYLTEARSLFKLSNEKQAEASCLMRLGEIIRFVDKDGARECWERVVELVGKDKEEDRRVRRVSMWLGKLNLEEDHTLSMSEGGASTTWESPLTDAGFEEVADEGDRRRHHQQELEGDEAWWTTKAH